MLDEIGADFAVVKPLAQTAESEVRVRKNQLVTRPE